MSEMNENKISELAARIYDLDRQTYEASGSELGRVYMGDQEKNITAIKALLRESPDGHVMRREIALIGNMARTVPDKATKKSLMHQYNAIIKEVRTLARESNVDILDPKFVSLNESASGKNKKRGENDHLIICISRTEGSAGTDIGFALADELHISYYDSEVFHDVIDRQDQEKDARYESVKMKLEDHPLLQNKTVRQLSRNHGLPKADAEFFNASALLKELAKTEDFVIVGRCADVILQNNHIPYISVYITAPVEQRIRRLMELKGMTFREAAKRVARSDSRRRRYYRYYTGRVWGLSTNYDLCINSARYGIEEATHLILRIIGRDYTAKQ